MEERVAFLEQKVDFLESIVDDIVSAIKSTQDNQDFQVNWLLKEWDKYEKQFITNQSN